MIFIDTNIFMYAAGSGHPNKIPSTDFLHKIARHEIEACINVEVLQEILHRYRHIGRWDDGKEVFSLVKKIVPVIVSVDLDIIDSAFKLLEKYPGIYARDGLHAAACLAMGVREICSYDSDFDCIEELRRIEP